MVVKNYFSAQKKGGVTEVKCLEKVLCTLTLLLSKQGEKIICIKLSQKCVSKLPQFVLCFSLCISTVCHSLVLLVLTIITFAVFVTYVMIFCLSHIFVHPTLDVWFVDLCFPFDLVCGTVWPIWALVP